MENNKEDLVKAIKSFAGIIINCQDRFMNKTNLSYRKLDWIAADFGKPSPEHFIHAYRDEMRLFGIEFDGQYIRYNGRLIFG